LLVSELIDRVYNEWLYPAGVDRPIYEVLSTTIDSDDTTIVVPGSRVGRIPPDSLIEIDDELILLEASSGGTLTANERGYANTTAASHTAGVKVFVDPKYPRKTVMSAIDTVTGLLYPWGIYKRVVDTSMTYESTELVDLPAACKRVIRYAIKTSTSQDFYRRAKVQGRDWIFYNEFNPPKIQFVKGSYVGAPIQLVYAADFTRGLSVSQDLTTDGGIPATLVDHMPMAIAGQILQGREIPRVQIDEIRRLLAINGVQVGQALNVGQSMLNAFRATYIPAERRRLAELDPSTFEQVF
jgi:hypothetical protein